MSRDRSKHERYRRHSHTQLACAEYVMNVTHTSGTHTQTEWHSIKFKFLQMLQIDCSGTARHHAHGAS